MSTITPSYIRLFFLSFLILGLTILSKLHQPQAGTLSSAAVTMSNSRLSYRGETAAVSGTIVDIAIDADVTDYTDSNPDTDITDVLKVNDVINFGTPDVPVNRTIQEIVDANTVVLTSAITHPDDFFLAEKSALTVTFTTRTNVTNGSFQLMVPAAAATNTDGIPDQGYFDYDTDTPTVTCSGTSHNFGTQAGTANQTVSGYSGKWHVYNCAYTGGATGSAITMNISDVINPMPNTAHDTGTADTYDVYIRHLDGSAAEVDVTRVKIGVIEAVRVSATVVPSLSFTITGQTTGATMCGGTADVTTTANTVPFGELVVATFTDASQVLDVATNADDGAAVTAQIYDQLGRNGVACTGSFATQYDCIWDANVTSMTYTTAQDWTTQATETGFAYSLDDYNSSSTEAFAYNSGGTFMAKHFADYNRGSTPQAAQTIFTTGGNPTNSADLRVCYRISVDSITSAGDYHTFITYTATATF